MANLLLKKEKYIFINLVSRECTACPRPSRSLATHSLAHLSRPHPAGSIHGKYPTGVPFFLSHSIFFLYFLIFRYTNPHHCVTIVYRGQYSNMLCRFGTQGQEAVPHNLGAQWPRPPRFVSLHSAMFARLNHLMTHFTECNPVVKQHMTVTVINWE